MNVFTNFDSFTKVHLSSDKNKKEVKFHYPPNCVNYNIIYIVERLQNYIIKIPQIIILQAINFTLNYR